ncbi:MAG: 2OG-Fe(II) oxygenase [Rhodospirillales bacterium]|nr:2OG-Fe(II) oxygenase [Rhodospirillales bacterium]
MRTGRYALHRGALSPAECGAVLATDGRRQWMPSALYGAPGDGETVNRDVWDGQRTAVCDDWLLARLDEVVRPMRRGLRFALAREPVWWNRHGRGVGFGEHYDRISSEDNPRILTCTVLLSAADAYEGGAFMVAGRVVPMHQGDAVVFSALTMHAVAPVAAGRRDSLVRWYLAR